MENETVLPDEAFDKFLEEIEKPAEAIPALRELLEKPPVWGK